MAKKTYESYRKDYFQAIFDTEYPERERIEAALDRAHEIRQFEISLYWQKRYLQAMFGTRFPRALRVLGLMLTPKRKLDRAHEMPTI